ncbi:MAG: hypothetical protein J6B87_00345 [Clostridia bacterium]|nr:hypothetical protein [Clostridia bacterium]
MKSIGFVGEMDKTGLLLCTGKMIASLGLKVMLVDATKAQKTRYVVPLIMDNETQEQYITQHDGVEVAVGFNNILELKKYLLSKGEDFSEYEYILIDSDNEEMCDEYDLKSANNLFFVTTFDKLHLAKGLELLKFLCASKRREDPNGSVNVEKILSYTQTNIKAVDDRYIERLTENLPINWANEKIITSYDEGDLSAFIQNQYRNKIEFRDMTPQTKLGIIDIVSVVTGEDKARLKKVLKSIEKNARFIG